MLIQHLGNELYAGSCQGRFVVVDGNKLNDEYNGVGTYRYLVEFKNPQLEVIKKLLYSYEN